MLRALGILSASFSAGLLIANDLQAVIARHETSKARLESIDVEFERHGENESLERIRLRLSPLSRQETNFHLPKVTFPDGTSRATTEADVGFMSGINSRRLEFKNGTLREMHSPRLDLFKMDAAFRTSGSLSIYAKAPYPGHALYEFITLQSFVVALTEKAMPLSALVSATLSKPVLSQVENSSTVRLQLRHPGFVGADGRRQFANTPMEIDFDPEHGWMVSRIKVELENNNKRGVVERRVEEFSEPAPKVFVPSKTSVTSSPSGDQQVYEFKIRSCNQPFPRDESMEICNFDGQLVREYNAVGAEVHTFHVVGPDLLYEKTFTDEKEALHYQYLKIEKMRGNQGNSKFWTLTLSVATLVGLSAAYWLYRKRRG